MIPIKNRGLCKIDFNAITPNDLTLELERVINEQEGGFKLVDVEDDSGGKTYAGMSTLLAQKLLKDDTFDWSEVPADKFNSFVADLYSAYLKHPIWEHLLPCSYRPTVSSVLLFGWPRTIRAIQHGLGVKTDGIFGPKTLAGLTSGAQWHDSFWRGFFHSLRIESVRSVKAKPTNLKFLEGWINRIHSLEKGVLDD